MSNFLRTRMTTCAAMTVAAAVYSHPATGNPAFAQQQTAGSMANDPALRDYLSANGLLNRGMNELAVGEYRKFLTAHPSHEKAVIARYGLGVALFRMKKYEEAAAEIRPVLEAKDFEFAAETLLIVGQSEFELKNWQAAAEPLATLAKTQADHDAADDAAAMAVEALYRLERYDQIDDVWSGFEKRWPESALRERADYLRGMSLVARKNDADAAKHFAAMGTRFPEGQFAERALLLRAQCLHRTNDRTEAAKAYTTLLDRDDAIGADAVFGMAVLSLQSDDEQAAAELYDRFLEKWPDHPSSATARIDRGRLCVGQRQYDRARTLLADGAKGMPSRADEAAYWLAKCDLREGRFTEAADQLKKAIEAHASSRLLAEMKYDRGLALSKTEAISEAIGTLDDFRSSFPDHVLIADATALQATLEHQRGGYDASAALCEVFLAKHADHPQAAMMAFLAAEDDMLRDQLDDAVIKYEAFLAKHPDDAQARTARYRLGSAQFRLQRFDDAAANLNKIVDGRNTDKAYRRGLLMLGDMAFQKSDWDQAVTSLGDYLSYGSDQPAADDAMLKAGLALARSDRHDEAIARFSELLETYPDSVHRVQAQFERGQVMLTADRLTEAKKDFEQVVDAKASRFRIYAMNHLATIAMRTSEWDQAVTLYAQIETEPAEATDVSVKGDAPFRRGQALMAAKKYPEAAAAFAKALDAEPSEQRAAETHAQRAIALSRSGEHEQALASMSALAKLSTRDVHADVLAAVAYERAWCLRELDRTDEAMQAYRDLLATHKNDVNAPHAMLELAELEAGAGHHEQAVELLSQLAAIADETDRGVEPTVRERGLYRLVVSAFELKRFDDAARYAEAFLTTFQSSDLIASALLFAGESHFRQSRWQAAGEHFAVLSTRHRDDDGCATALLRLGECHAQLQRWPESEQTFAEYLERFSESDLWFQAQFGVAYAREHRGLHDQAIESYRKVIDRHSGPTAARAQFQIGECLFAQKKYADAVRELLKVDILYGYPEWSAAALFEAGRCFEELGQHEQAQTQFALVKEKYPDTEWAKLATQRLASANGSKPGDDSGPGL